MQNNKTKKIQQRPGNGWFFTALVFVLMQVSPAWAADSAITGLNFSSLAGDKVQIQLEMNGPVTVPKVFQTDNPSRIALDFTGVKSELDKKMFAINQGAASTVYVVEGSGRTRVVINLTRSVPYETKVDGNNVYVVLKPVNSISSVKNTAQEQVEDVQITKLLPEQTIKGIDFRRGPKGEGRLLLELSTANTVVDVKEQGGKVVLNFFNTKLPEALVKSFNVTDFATPVQKIDAQTRGAGVRITVTPVDGNYDYSSYQSDGLLTVDFIPLTAAEKDALLKEKFPYSGSKLSLNFQDIEVRSVLQILADFTELNIIAADTVKGTVTLRLNDVPWDQALDLILKSKGLAKRQAGNVILVAPTAEITKIEEEELAAKMVVEQLEPLRTEYIQINYAKAEDIQALLTGKNVAKSSGAGSSQPDASGFLSTSSRFASQSNSKGTVSDGLLSKRGRSTVDERTNTLIIKDTVKQLEEIRRLINLLDVPIRQVMIESRIVIAETSFARNLGVKFGVAKTGEIGSDKQFGFGSGANSGIPVGTIDPQTGIFTQTGGGTFARQVTGDDGVGEYLVDLAAAGISNHPVGALGMTLARAADYVLNLELTALENDGGGEVLANPRVMTIDRETATIKQGVQIPFETVSQEGTQTQLIDAVLELTVTPQITPSGEVIMELLIKKDSPDLGTGGIEKREVDTTVQVKDGETVVLGGIYEQQNAKEIFKIPFFGDLPGVGFLFKKKEISDVKTELLVFITPKIVKNTLSAR